MKAGHSYLKLLTKKMTLIRRDWNQLVTNLVEWQILGKEVFEGEKVLVSIR